VNRRGLIWVLAALAAVGLAITPSASIAKAKKKKKAPVLRVITAAGTATGTTAGSAPSATATCPAGTRAIGGGFSAPASAIGGFVPQQSVRVGTNQWQASGFVLGSGPIVLTVEVYCAKFGGQISEVAANKQVTAASDSAATVAAACPAGTRLAAGGFAAPSVPTALGFAVVNESSPQGASWNVSAKRGVGASAAADLSARAYCYAKPSKKKKKHKKKKTLPVLRPLVTTQGSATLPTPSLARASATSAPCPASYHAVTSGFVTAALSTTSRPVVDESRVVAGTAIASAFEGVTATVAPSLTAFLGCV
jgi:hypothetical protein